MKNSNSRRPSFLATFVLSRWHEIQANFWFLPGMIVLSAVLLASLLILFDGSLDLPDSGRWSLIFGASASGARDLLSVVASSMVTVAGVVFSITIVALSLTSSQYTSRVLRNFMSDRLNQTVLGVFVGIFAYCLVVLRVIRGADEGSYVPSLAVLVALLLAFVGIGYLIFFIHNISVSIQASSIIAAAAQETIRAVDKLFPEPLGHGADNDDCEEISSIESSSRWKSVPSKKTGYIESIDNDSLLAFAEDNGVVIRMERAIGEFIIEDTPLFSIKEPNQMGEEQVGQLYATAIIGGHRTLTQDVGFGVRQIVDIALKALSPGVNDTTTAVMCIDYLSAILLRLATRQIPSPLRMSNNTLRVIARGPSFNSLLGEAFNQIRQCAGENTAVLIRILDSFEILVRETIHPPRKKLLLRQATLISELAESSIDQQYDRDRVSAAMSRFSKALETSYRQEAYKPER